MFLAMLNPNANEGGREFLFAFAVAPFIAGVLLKRLVQYVVTGE
jgi:hypothetical protein